MSSPYVGEIRMFAGNFAPSGWAFCDGSLLAIADYETLFQLIGTTYGGDGENTFALPNLQGRVPVHQASGFTMGQTAGSEAVPLTTQQLPVHSHSFFCSTNPGGTAAPVGNVLAAEVGGSAYVQMAPTTALAPASLSPDSGGGQPHNNLQPYVCVSFIISLFGTFPSQT